MEEETKLPSGITVKQAYNPRAPKQLNKWKF